MNFKRHSGKIFGVTLNAAERRAIRRYDMGIASLECGGKLESDNGNGALMRILPVALYSDSVQDVEKATTLTHAHSISRITNLSFWCLCQEVLFGAGVKEGIREIKWQCAPPFNRLPYLDTLTRDEIRSSGYVVDTLEAALWCILKTDNYRDCVLMAVNLGEDTDTVAAVAGGLAGIAYGIGGEKGIPEEWIKQIPRREWIAKLCAKVES
ncbi:ADP-ribosylglycohydrolase family protein [Acutalibacter caecimuris]|uniref:ADP-ribosylglycohydrolase family protein n=1 Tax=Acutalibacter caecimuris TaxID=3093657 RepID=UPI002AC8F54B|nr:ADP-ribosylglycohydrolase family protein [Acutalibacter sp. M00118]